MEIIESPSQGDYGITAFPFLLPLLNAVVIRTGGRLLVRQYLTKTTRNIAIRNAHLAGKRHPVTKVRFNNKGFPIFSSKHHYTMPNTYLKSPNTVHYRLANGSLRKRFNNSSMFRRQFTKQQQKDIRSGKTPRGYTWHHHQTRGKMQLVKASTHRKTGHTGGRAIWGIK
ncbi:HNH endonuclease [Lentibacillus saliphilus]|uniref:HNH endonuclease n=1 Tax=Lentibacillus saliphilus TaxID=2737028 RepID=UPI001C303A9D|nr:HNH endonuclease [Lentibacillus saliphilus]